MYYIYVVMKKYLLLVFTMVSIYASAQTGSRWYQLLQGTIGAFPITMHLHKMGHIYTGYYYYNKTQQLITITGEDTTNEGAIYLYAYTPGAKNSESFTFTLSGNNAKGKWQVSVKNRSLPFSAQVVTPDSLILFRYAYTNGERILRPTLTTSPQATFEYGTIWPENNSTKGLYIKKEITQLLDEKIVPDDINTLLRNRQQQYFTHYIQQNKSASDKEVSEMTPAFSADETNRILLAYQSPDIVTMAHYFYTYTGGAHGMHGTRYIVLGLKHNKQLKLTDILSEEGRSALSQLLAKYFRKTYDLKPTDPLTTGGLFKNTIQPNDNFYITQKGIGFNYQPYEIGPYALGDVEVFIPFSELPSMVKDVF